MKNKSNFYLGIFLIGLGLIFLLRNLGYVHVSIAQIFHLWPFLFIIMGLRYIPMSPKMRDTVNIVLLLAFFGLLFFGPQVHWRKSLFGMVPVDIYYSSEDETEDNTDTLQTNTNGTNGRNDFYFFTEMNPEIQSASMELNLAAADFQVKEPTDKLYELILEDLPYPIKSDFSVEGHKALIRISPENQNGSHRINNLATGELHLNAQIPWDMTINAGASALELDFSPYIIRKIDIHSGAAQLDLKLGDRASETDVEISSGASDMTIHVPEKSGVEVEINNVFSSKSLPGFRKVGKNLYRNDQYNKASHKIKLRINSAISQLKIRTY